MGCIPTPEGYSETDIIMVTCDRCGQRIRAVYGGVPAMHMLRDVAKWCEDTATSPPRESK